MTRQLPLGLGHGVSHAREDLVVGEANAEALAWIDAWPGWPSPALLLLGPPGSGKTHLADLWSARAGALPVNLGGVTAVMTAEPGRTVLIEDVDRALAELGSAAERILFHALNLLAQDRGSMLLTARRHPREWSLVLPDLSSRLRAAAMAEIRAPDDAMIGGVLAKLFADRQLAPDPDVIDFIVQRTERSFERLARLVEALDRAALAARRELTLPFVRETLARERLID
ncbi:MAG: hypothetical protein FJX57_12965 [Alphaproteobacteria bacterium]|nr:hypothetical protein [Alphaproteobacteria bacterium]